MCTTYDAASTFPFSELGEAIFGDVTFSVSAGRDDIVDEGVNVGISASSSAARVRIETMTSRIS